MMYIVFLITLRLYHTSLLFSFGSVYDSMGCLDEQGLSSLKGEAVPHE